MNVYYLIYSTKEYEEYKNNLRLFIEGKVVSEEELKNIQEIMDFDISATTYANSYKEAVNYFRDIFKNSEDIRI